VAVEVRSREEHLGVVGQQRLLGHQVVDSDSQDRARLEV
jgi:hypothetical protein